MARALTSLGLVLSFAIARATPAFAQSSASFPPEPGSEPAPPAPTEPPPVAPAPAPPPPVPPPAAPPPPQQAPPPPQQAPPQAPPPPAPTGPTWLDQRGPEWGAPAAPAPTPAQGDLRPPLLPYRDGLPVPPGYRVVNRPASGLLIAGMALGAASYGAALLVAAGQDFENGTGWLALPVIGPWAAIGARSFSCGPVTAQTTNKCVGDAFDEVETIVFVAVDGLLQATSVALLIAGAASGHKELVRKDIKVGVAPPAPGRSDWRLGVSGAF